VLASYALITLQLSVIFLQPVVVLVCASAALFPNVLSLIELLTYLSRTDAVNHCRRTLKPGFHYPSSQPEFTGCELGIVNSGNRALDLSTAFVSFHRATQETAPAASVFMHRH